MRLRNVVGAKDIINANIYINRGIDELPNKKTYLEIGMGKGDFIIANAKRYPNINFIGVEKYDSVLVRAIEKIDELVKKDDVVLVKASRGMELEKIVEYLNK